MPKVIFNSRRFSFASLPAGHHGLGPTARAIGTRSLHTPTDAVAPQAGPIVVLGDDAGGNSVLQAVC